MTPDQAEEEMFGRVRDALAPFSLPVSWPNVAFETPTEGPWARVGVSHQGGAQASLSDRSGRRRWRYTGVLSVEIFARPGLGLSESNAIVKALLNAFEGQDRSGVWHTNARFTESGKSRAHNLTTFLVDFQYDDHH